MMSLTRVDMGITGRGALWEEVQGVYITGKEESREGFSERRETLDWECLRGDVIRKSSGLKKS